MSLTHEQALVDYDPSRIRPDQLLQTSRDIGYTIWDPRKLRPFEDEERDLVREGRRLLAAVVLMQDAMNSETVGSDVAKRREKLLQY